MFLPLCNLLFSLAAWSPLEIYEKLNDDNSFLIKQKSFLFSSKSLLFVPKRLSEVKSSRFFVLSLISLSDDGTFRWFYALQIEFHGFEWGGRMIVSARIANDSRKGWSPNIFDSFLMAYHVFPCQMIRTFIHTPRSKREIIYRENSSYVRKWEASRSTNLNNARQT